MASLRIPAPAKINLALRILARRDDGYHELDTVFQAIALADDVVLSEAGAPGVRLDVSGADVGPPDDNLAVRAARAWQVATGIDPAVEIRLTKRIPAGAGLGGGSSDAGAVLRGLEAMYGHPLGAERLAEVGAVLGADVAFFCGEAGLARGRGVGDQLHPLPDLPARPLVVVIPPVPVSTPAAYGWIVEARRDGAPVSSEFELPAAPRWPDLDRIAGNDFHEVVTRRLEPVARAAAAMEAAGLEGVLLSGSGSALFGFLPDAEPQGTLDRLNVELADSGCRAVATHTLPGLAAPHPPGTEA